MTATPTSRSLEYCRKQGLDAGVVERWNPHAGIRQDLFGFIDLIVMDHGALAVQATSGSNASKRIAKIIDEPRARTWLDNGCKIEVWSWRKIKVKRGGKAVRWELDRRPVTLADFNGAANEAER